MMKFAVILSLILPLIHPKELILKIHIDTNDLESSGSDPPAHTDYAKMARWLVHNLDWTSMSTISTYPDLIGYPMVNVVATADSEIGAKSTGNIYFYLTLLDFTAKDLSKSNKLTTLFSMEQTLYCSEHKVDAMEPTCARVIMSGEALRLKEDSEEHKFATNAMVSRHPASAAWVLTHSFFLCKMNISSIIVLDWYGGAQFVKVDDYYRVNLD